MPLKPFFLRLALPAVLLLSLTPSAGAQPRPGPAPDALKRLSLEALGDIEVTTVSKDPEEIRRVPAAVFVITQDDIRRSGATSIPEVLRLAPGIHVGRIDSDHWSVGVRGFGDQFSKSVLVLIDGRSVYTPLLAGVMWAVQDVLLEDVDRIEVIRGPGGTIWGSNAVNGVINIITKSASQTSGVVASFGAGNVDRAVSGVRYGGRVSGIDYRVYARGFDRGPQKHVDDTDFDEWRQGQTGFRADWTGARESVTLQGDLYRGRNGQSVSLASFSPPSQTIDYDPLNVSGGNLLLFWRRSVGGRGDVQVRAYYDRTHFLGPQLGETRNTFDVDLVSRVSWWAGQDLTWGAGMRKSPGTAIQTVPTLDFIPRSQTNSLYTAFLQDEISVAGDKVRLSAGSKFEHNIFTGLEVQPSARALWNPRPAHSLWAAVTRAVRTPSRLEDGFQYYGLLASQPIPTYLLIAGNPDFDVERRVAWEGGYRAALAPSLYVDVAAFHHDVDNLQSLGASTVTIETSPIPFALLTFPYANGVEGESNGIEIAPRWKPSPFLEARASYSYLKISTRLSPGHADTSSVATYNGSSPRHQMRLQLLTNWSRGWESDVVVRAVSSLPARQVGAYQAVDLRVGQQVSDRWNWSVAGQNLTDAEHLEFGHDPGPAVAMRRSVYASITWRR